MTSSPEVALLVPRYTAATRVLPIKPATAGNVLNDFGARLLTDTPEQTNVVVSPYSVCSVLAMVAAGSRGRTADQLARLLGAEPADQAAVITTVEQALAKAVVAGGPQAGDPRYHDVRPFEMHHANTLFADLRFAVRPDFVRELAAWFGAGIYQVDYRDRPDAARLAINGWIREHTGGLIPELLSAGDVAADTVLILANAVHLIAPWVSPFRRDRALSPFAVATGETVQLSYMRRTGWYRNGDANGWTWVSIPYRGGRLAMTIIVPAPGGFDTVRNDLARVLTAVVAELTASVDPAGSPVTLAIPSFTVRTRLSLREQLGTLGVTDLFDPFSVDLSQIAGGPGDLVVGDVVHEALITIDEEGTEAAAATAMSLMATGAPSEPQQLTVDRSFFIVVHDTVTGGALFLGQVIDPTS